MVTVHTLAAVYALGFCLGDVDMLVGSNLASYANKNGRTMVRMDAEQCLEVVQELRDHQRYRR